MKLQRLSGFLRLAAVVGGVGLLLPLHLKLRARRGSSVVATTWFRWGARILRLRFTLTGEAACTPALIVSNHISWADIIVLGGAAEAVFAAKSDVRRWPLLGWLASIQGTIFLERTERSSVGAQRGMIAERLATGTSVILFAEGTSSDGRAVLPFKSALFDAAMQTGVPVQPVTILWVSVGGEPVGDDNRLRIAWIDDMTLPPHLWALLKGGGATARIVFHPLLRPQDFRSRAELARRCHEVVASALPYAALRKRSE